VAIRRGTCLFFDHRAAFWWPIIQPYPWVARTQRWLIVPYLFPRGHSEHRPLSFPHFLRACALSDLRDCPPHYESHPARRSSGPRARSCGLQVSVFFSRSSCLVTIRLLSTRQTLASRKQATRSQLCSICTDALGEAGTIKNCKVGFAFASIYRPASTLATLSALRSTNNVPIGGSGSNRWPVGATNGAHEPGRRSTLDALARTDSVRLINSRKHLCFRPARSTSRASWGRRVLPARWSWPRAFPFKVDRDLFIVAVLLGLRSVQPMGEHESHGHVSDGYFAAAIVVDDGPLHGRELLQVRLSDRSISIHSIARSPVEVGVRNLAVAARVKRMTAFAETNNNADASCNSSSHSKRATWIAPSA